jgi:hypothetical protein
MSKKKKQLGKEGDKGRMPKIHYFIIYNARQQTDANNSLVLSEGRGSAERLVGIICILRLSGPIGQLVYTHIFLKNVPGPGSH